MRITAIIGSPLGMKGNTGRLLNGVIAGCKEAGADVKLIELCGLKVGPCKGCGSCHVTGDCAVKDDYARVKKAMVEADGIIFASPNYISCVTAQMKALFDRCSSILHCQAFEGKYGIAVVTSGGPESKEVENYILHFLGNLGCWTVGSIGAEARQIADEKARSERLVAAAALGKQFTEAIGGGKTYPEQARARKAFFERMKMLVTMNRDNWPYEYSYWKSAGRLS